MRLTRDHLIAAVTFSIVHRDVRSLKNIDSSLCVAWTFCNPKTRRNPASTRNLQRPDRSAQAFRDLETTVFISFHQQHGKLFAANPRRQIDASRAFTQDLADPAYGIVA